MIVFELDRGLSVEEILGLEMAKRCLNKEKENKKFIRKIRKSGAPFVGEGEKYFILITSDGFGKFFFDEASRRGGVVSFSTKKLCKEHRFCGTDKIIFNC
ncbi:MAG: hypothetical protein HY228_03100 [Candidatus Yonathbacteria bacterium]|nr:hypothetical protein [Candidatus Yonathbacteria bacterium]